MHLKEGQICLGFSPAVGPQLTPLQMILPLSLGL